MKRPLAVGLPLVAGLLVVLALLVRPKPDAKGEERKPAARRSGTAQIRDAEPVVPEKKETGSVPGTGPAPAAAEPTLQDLLERNGGNAFLKRIAEIDRLYRIYLVAAENPNADDLGDHIYNVAYGVEELTEITPQTLEEWRMQAARELDPKAREAWQQEADAVERDLKAAREVFSDEAFAEIVEAAREVFRKAEDYADVSSEEPGPEMERKRSAFRASYESFRELVRRSLR